MHRTFPPQPAQQPRSTRAIRAPSTRDPPIHTESSPQEAGESPLPCAIHDVLHAGGLSHHSAPPSVEGLHGTTPGGLNTQRPFLEPHVAACAIVLLRSVPPSLVARRLVFGLHSLSATAKWARRSVQVPHTILAVCKGTTQGGEGGRFTVHDDAHVRTRQQ